MRIIKRYLIAGILVWAPISRKGVMLAPLPFQETWITERRNPTSILAGMITIHIRVIR